MMRRAATGELQLNNIMQLRLEALKCFNVIFVLLVYLYTIEILSNFCTSIFCHLRKVKYRKVDLKDFFRSYKESTGRKLIVL